MTIDWQSYETNGFYDDMMSGPGRPREEAPTVEVVPDDLRDERVDDFVVGHARARRVRKADGALRQARMSPGTPRDDSGLKASGGLGVHLDQLVVKPANESDSAFFLNECSPRFSPRCTVRWGYSRTRARKRTTSPTS